MVVVNSNEWLIRKYELFPTKSGIFTKTICGTHVYALSCALLEIVTPDILDIYNKTKLSQVPGYCRTYLGIAY